MDKAAARERIEKLKKEINRYRYAYHALNQSLISDEALDSLKKELFDLEQEYPEFITPDSPTQRVAGKPLKEFRKVEHIEPMLSFNDAFSREDMEDWLKRVENYLGRKVKQDFYCELKLDGLAVELVYENGILIQGLTRGAQAAVLDGNRLEAVILLGDVRERAARGVGLLVRARAGEYMEGGDANEPAGKEEARRQPG